MAGFIMAAGLGTAIVGGAAATADTGTGTKNMTSTTGPTVIARKAGERHPEYLPINDPPQTPPPTTSTTPTTQPK
jgi:hypothetical protein